MLFRSCGCTSARRPTVRPRALGYRYGYGYGASLSAVPPPRPGGAARPARRSPAPAGACPPQRSRAKSFSRALGRVAGASAVAGRLRSPWKGEMGGIQGTQPPFGADLLPLRSAQNASQPHGRAPGRDQTLRRPRPRGWSLNLTPPGVAGRARSSASLSHRPLSPSLQISWVQSQRAHT